MENKEGGEENIWAIWFVGCELEIFIYFFLPDIPFETKLPSGGTITDLLFKHKCFLYQRRKISGSIIFVIKEWQVKKNTLKKTVPGLWGKAGRSAGFEFCLLTVMIETRRTYWSELCCISVKIALELLLHYPFRDETQTALFNL